MSDTSTLQTREIMGRIRKVLEQRVAGDVEYVTITDLLIDCADAIFALGTHRKSGTLGWQFTVSPARGFADRFPVDMLRYDSCFPMHEKDTGEITQTFGRYSPEIQPRSVELFSVTKPPSIDRWLSFGWAVSNVREVR